MLDTATTIDTAAMPAALSPAPLSPADAEALRANLIADAIAELRPNLKAHGGDCELVRVEGNTAFVRLAGACVGCALASVTISGVQERLIRKLGFPVRVVPAH
ncbi:Iron-sulfur cluster assembly scaffold protein NifU [Rhodovulum sp. PH10]|uniref:NifU family protein n=1 Tax=Rhodovulum sp. PH10 TaxID=1187851 RepID=UPI00027C1E9E|nr:NifU family protein [Rhodovulum sp. PH10]EJW10394.1 Iron-sulfur cluster assembly scaffold protein NifU [Rhodovulum sp. PH10]